MTWRSVGFKVTALDGGIELRMSKSGVMTPLWTVHEVTGREAEAAHDTSSAKGAEPEAESVTHGQPWEAMDTQEVCTLQRMNWRQDHKICVVPGADLLRCLGVVLALFRLQSSMG